MVFRRRDVHVPALDWNTSVEARATLALALGTLGRQPEAQKIRAELVAQANSSYVAPVYLFLAQVGAGDADSAFHWLAASIENRDVLKLSLRLQDPRWAWMRDDPRWEKAMAHLARVDALAAAGN